jgi:hypothetical protein
LKPTEKRAGPWFEAFGVEQTEIDALATLRPDLLRQLAHEAIAPFFDSRLTAQVLRARAAWLEQAQQIIDDSLGTDELDRIRAEAAEKLQTMQEQIDEINDALRVSVDDFDLPELEIPESELDPDNNDDAPLPLIDSRDDWTEQTLGLLDSRSYRGSR